LNIKGVLIDFGYTLAYIDEEEDRRYRQDLVLTLENNKHRTTLCELSPLLDKAYRSNRAGESKDMFEFWEFFLNSMGIPESKPLIMELEKSRRHYVGKTIRLYDGVVPVLTDLQKKYRLALVSNCSTGLSDVIEASGLDHFFECIILSYEVGVRKPHIRIYLEALERLKLEPEGCIFVADEISDLEGARKVGLKTLLVHQGPHTTHEAKDPNFKPDFQCDNISEITNFL